MTLAEVINTYRLHSGETPVGWMPVTLCDGPINWGTAGSSLETALSSNYPLCQDAA